MVGSYHQTYLAYHYDRLQMTSIVQCCYLRGSENTQVWAVDLSLLLGQLTFRPVILNLPYWNSSGCWRGACLAEDRRAY